MADPDFINNSHIITMTWKQRVSKIFQRFGYDLRRYRPDMHSWARRMKQMEVLGIDLVIDIGANAGQFGEELRQSGYTGRICSFEPLGEAFSKLKTVSAGDQNWDVHNYALGSVSGKGTIHIAGNSCSSSLLNMLPSHEKVAPHTKYVDKEEISIEQLDNLMPEIGERAHAIWLKIDTQGFEHEIILGAEKSLERIDTVQMEVSLIPLYGGAPDFSDMISLMRAKGYGIIDVDPEFCDVSTGRMLQMNITFRRDG